MKRDGRRLYICSNTSYSGMKCMADVMLCGTSSSRDESRSSLTHGVGGDVGTLSVYVCQESEGDT